MSGVDSVHPLKRVPDMSVHSWSWHVRQAVHVLPHPVTKPAAFLTTPRPGRDFEDDRYYAGGPAAGPDADVYGPRGGPPGAYGPPREAYESGQPRSYEDEYDFTRGRAGYHSAAEGPYGGRGGRPGYGDAPGRPMLDRGPMLDRDYDRDRDYGLAPHGHHSSIPPVGYEWDGYGGRELLPPPPPPRVPPPPVREGGAAGGAVSGGAAAAAGADEEEIDPEREAYEAELARLAAELERVSGIGVNSKWHYRCSGGIARGSSSGMQQYTGGDSTCHSSHGPA